MGLRSSRALRPQEYGLCREQPLRRVPAVTHRRRADPCVHPQGAPARGTALNKRGGPFRCHKGQRPVDRRRAYACTPQQRRQRGRRVCVAGWTRDVLHRLRPQRRTGQLRPLSVHAQRRQMVGTAQPRQSREYGRLGDTALLLHRRKDTVFCLEPPWRKRRQRHLENRVPQRTLVGTHQPRRQHQHPRRREMPFHPLRRPDTLLRLQRP